MKVREVFDRYVEHHAHTSSLGAHQGKLEKFILFVQSIDITSAFMEKNLRAFVFDNQQSPAGKYDALYSFHQFYYKNILNLEGREVPFFPIESKEVKVAPNKDKEDGTVYFPIDFDFNLLFNDRYYEHLKSEPAKLMVKAAFSLALSAGYDSGEMFPTSTKGRKSSIMTLNDYIIESDHVKVRNYYEQSTVPWVLIRGKNAEYIKEYHYLRCNSNVKNAGQENNFIAQIWNSSELKFDKNIVDNKPYSPHSLVTYMLKYITNKLELKTPRIIDLRANMVLHSLYNSKGSALRDIIEICGYPPFVKKAFDKYCLVINRGVETYFSPLSFDTANGSSEVTIFESEEVKKKVRTREDILTKWIRDSTSVTKLKSIYNNCCQICGDQLTLIPGLVYSEVHHIQPFNKEHKGVDDHPNMIVLCPNHHKLFDLGILALNPDSHNVLLHVDEQNELHNTMLKLSKHNLSSTCVRYHFENIFKELSNRLYK